MDTKRWIIFGVIVASLFGSLVYLSNKNKIDVSGVNEKTVLAASKNSGNIADHVFGNKDSKVILVEYGDFQCPGCGGAHPTLKTLSEKYKDQIAFVFRNFPLTTKHPNARAAAAAVEAAGLQGKYWEMHNAVFESQNDWGESEADQRTDVFIAFAKRVGVADIAKFTEDLTNPAINRKISFDQAIGKKVGVTGTPTIVLNGVIVAEDITNDTVQGAQKGLLEKEILRLLKQAGIKLPENS